MAATQLLLCNNGCSFSIVAATKSYNSKPSIVHNHKFYKNKEILVWNGKSWPKTELLISKYCIICHAARRKPTISDAAFSSDKGNGDTIQKALQIILWVLEGVYILWLFLLPYAPGDPVWAISKETVGSLIGLSLNFFFILPLLNSGG